MADSASASVSGSEETQGQRQARLRREKRTAKIQSEGSDRLSKITQLNGRIAPPAELLSPGPKAATAINEDDPDEVDISEHHWTPSSRQNAVQPQQNPFAGMPGMGPPTDGTAEADPMMRMMQQMLGGAGGGGDPNDPNAMPDLPPMLKAMMGGQAQAQQQADQPKSTSAYLWRIVHAAFALTLAIYVALSTTFNGSSLTRVQSLQAGEGVGPKVFYMFATFELVLQSSRYFLEKGQLQGAGWLATIANSGMVSEPWAGYIRVLGRYFVIWETIVGDAMTVVFVLGCLAWWNGMGVA